MNPSLAEAMILLENRAIIQKLQMLQGSNQSFSVVFKRTGKRGSFQVKALYILIADDLLKDIFCTFEVVLREIDGG